MVGVVSVVVVGISAIYGLHPQSLRAADDVALLGIALSVIGLMPQAAKFFRWSMKPSGPGETSSTPEQVKQAREILANELRKQWQEEVEIRQLHEPHALTVRWRFTVLPVVDYPELIFGPDQLTSGQANFSVGTDSAGISALAAEFRSLARRRLVILGDPGMGKTTLAILLTRELLRPPKHERDEQAEPEPVPVLLTLSGWHTGNNLDKWLARRLGETYPRLLSSGQDIPRELVEQGHVLPVLDGLDELLPQSRLHLLEQVRAHDDPLILTCRTSEYQAAVTGPDGKALTGAAAIEPIPLEAADITAYLRHCLQRPLPDRWSDLLTTLVTRPDHPVTQALRTPLNVWLLRKTYIDAYTDKTGKVRGARTPTALLDTSRYPTPDVITKHLLGRLVPTLFDVKARPPDPDTEDPFQPRHTWEPDDASRWLSFLARHVQSHGGQGLAWWQLNYSLADYRRNFVARVRDKTGLGYRLTLGLGLGLVTLLGIYATAGVRQAGLVRPLAVLPVFAIFFASFFRRKTIVKAAGEAIEWIANLKIAPSYVNFGFLFQGIRSWLDFGPGILAAALRLGFVSGLFGGFIGALLGALVWWASQYHSWVGGVHHSGYTGGPTTWLLTGLVAGFAGWFLGGFLSMSLNLITYLATSPLTDDKPQTPAIVLHRDLQLAKIRLLTVGLPYGLSAAALFAVLTLPYGLSKAIPLGIIVGLLIGGVWGLAWVRDRPCLWYLVTVGILRPEQQVPRRLMAFLDDAHRVGLLRQMGAVYQFRHITLLDYFAPPTPQNLITRHAAAFPQARIRDPATANAALEELLADQLRVLGPEHPDTLTTRCEIASWRAWAEDPAEAAAGVAALEELLADQLRVLGPEHPDTLTTRCEIASWRAWAEDPAEAAAGVAALEELLADQLRVLGPEHPDTLTTRYEIASWRAWAEDPAEAAAGVAALEELLADQLRVLGPDNAVTLATRYHVAVRQAEDPAGPPPVSPPWRNCSLTS